MSRGSFGLHSFWLLAVVIAVIMSVFCPLAGRTHESYQGKRQCCYFILYSTLFRRVHLDLSGCDGEGKGGNSCKVLVTKNSLAAM